MKKTYKGSCHCGAVKFEADLDLEAGTGRCNCSYCLKIRFWGAIAKPEDFRLLAGEENLAAYAFNTHSGKHHFCRSCGIRPFGRAEVAELGAAFVSVNVATLDGIDDETLAALQIAYADGRNDAWHRSPSVTRHL